MTKYTIELSPSAIQKIEELKSNLHLRSEAEVLSRALTLLALADSLKDDKATITIGSQNKKEDVILDK